MNHSESPMRRWRLRRETRRCPHNHVLHGHLVPGLSSPPTGSHHPVLFLNFLEDEPGRQMSAAKLLTATKARRIPANIVSKTLSKSQAAGLDFRSTCSERGTRAEAFSPRYRTLSARASGPLYSSPIP
jgi:hypothetical protein